MVAGNGDDSDKTTVLTQESETLNKELEKAKGEAACLIVIRGPRQGQRYFITKPLMVMGRDPVADISIADPSVSRKHAQVSLEGDKVKLTDLGSQNGTVINGKKIPGGGSQILAKEDMVKIGNSILKFLPAGELEIIFYGALGSAAHTDPLTKIYNKRYLMEALEAEFKRAKALHTDFSILFFDIDHFKKVNDTHGHDAGDHILKEFASLVRTKHVREKDILARYGGEEFILLLAGMNGDAAMKVAEGVRASIETHAFIYEGKRIPITSSFGVAELTADIESATTLLKDADRALYQSKEGGRNKVTRAG